MGWLYMRSLGGHSGPKQYLDVQFMSMAMKIRA